jgi:hypothetical protein
MQDSTETHHLLKSQITCFMYRSECQSKGVLHIHEAFVMSEDIHMSEKKVREKIFKELEILQENCEKKVQKKIFKEVNVLQGNCYFHSKRYLIQCRRKYQSRKKRTRKIASSSKKKTRKIASSSQICWPHCKQGKIRNFREFDMARRALKIIYVGCHCLINENCSVKEGRANGYHGEVKMGSSHLGDFLPSKR